MSAILLEPDPRHIVLHLVITDIDIIIYLNDAIGREQFILWDIERLILANVMVADRNHFRCIRRSILAGELIGISEVQC